MKSTDALPFSVMSAFVVTRSAMSASVATVFVSGFTIAGASLVCSSRWSVNDGVAVGDGCGEAEDAALAVGEGDGVAGAAFPFGLGVATGTFRWTMQL